MIIENQSKLEAAFEDLSKDVARDAIDYWFEVSQDVLTDATSNRANIDAKRDSRGPLTGRRENNLYRIAQSANPPTWDGDAWEFTYTHKGATYQEWGTQPHDIEAGPGNMLVFEWPDAPPEVQDMFPNWEDDNLVFFKKVSHPGNPGIGFCRAGRNAAEQWIIDQRGNV